MKEIAITGGTGFIGQYFIRRACSNGDIHIKCLSSQYDFNRYYSNENVKYVHCGIDQESVARSISDCDTVIHLGSVVPNPEMHKQRLLTECSENIVYTTNLLNACKECGINNVVFASSISVYDNKQTTPCVETQRCDPQTLYGVTKLAIEKIAGLYNCLYGMNVKSLRISQVIGARKTIKRPVLNMLYENCIRAVPVTVFGTGTTAQDYIYVKDVAEAVIKAAAQEDTAGEFNIGLGREISVNELAEAYCQAFNNPAGIIHDQTKEERIIHWSMDIRKAEDQLGSFLLIL